MQHVVREAVRAMEAYIPGEQPEMAGVVKLNANENPYPPSPAALTALREAIDALPLYPEASSRVIREAAAEVYGLDPAQVMAVNASDEFLRLLCQCCVDGGDEVVVVHPTFPYYETLAAVQGARVRRIELTDELLLPPAEAMPDLGAARLVFLPNPGAPSGVVHPEAEVRRLIESAPRALVVVDEAYADFAGITTLPWLAEYPNLVVTRTFSKSYSLAGLRLGLGFASAALMEQFNKVRDFYNVDVLAQAAGAAALRDQAYLRDTCARVAAIRDGVANALRAMGLHVWPSGANFLLVRCGAPRAAGLYRELKERKILVRYWNKPRLDDCLRITIGTNAQMDLLLEILPTLPSFA